MECGGEFCKGKSRGENPSLGRRDGNLEQGDGSVDGKQTVWEIWEC